MQPEEKELLLSDIDKLACAACRLMTDDEREAYFQYQEARRESDQALKTKYTVPIRTYYKGKDLGQTKKVYEVDGAVFEKLWDKLYKYAVKSAMSSHQSNHYNNPDVQNDVCDIRYQTFYVLRYFGPTPNGKRFSQFFLLIVNNILTTSARRRGVYRELSEFLDWFDSNKYDERHFEAYQEHLSISEQFVPFIEYMFLVFVTRYFYKKKDEILEARKAYEQYVEDAKEQQERTGKVKPFSIKPFEFNVGNCEATMVNYKAFSMYEEHDENSDGTVTYFADTIEDTSSTPPDTEPFLRELLNSLEHSLDISVIDDALMKKPIKLLIKGESLTKIAKELNVKVEELRESLRGILPSLQ